MRQLRTVLALSLLIGASAGVEAKVTHLGKLTDGAARATTGSVHHGAFSDTVTFRLASESSVADIFTALQGITSFTIDLFSGSSMLGSFSGGAAGSPSTSFPTHLFGALAPSAVGQHYTLTISGTGSRHARYFNSIAVSAVPEADTWLMLMAGVGLVALQLRRKQRSLPQRPID
jgi:hypothetical protein